MKPNEEYSAPEKTSHAQGDFAKCRENLYRNTSSGVYYVRCKRNGKRFNESLKSDNGTPLTDLAQAAKALQRFLGAADARLATGTGAGATFADVAETWLARRQKTEHLKPGTHRFYKFAIVGLSPFFGETVHGEFVSKRCRDCNAADVAAWMGKRGEAMSNRTFNGELNTLKAIFAFAGSIGLMLANPAAPIKPKKIGDKKPATPAREEFLALVRCIRASAVSSHHKGVTPGRASELENNRQAGAAAADMVELMAYTGARKGEAVALRWQDVDFDGNGGRGLLTIHGQTDEAMEDEASDEARRLKGTKNGKTRYVPMMAAARKLLLRIRAEHRAAGIFAPSGFVLTHTGCRTALESAAVRMGTERLQAGGMDYKPAREQAKETAHVWTHHDFRHFFVTTCIEKGVDIPTVAKWVGHQDGGALLMRTYAHIRDAHSGEMASKVDFGSEDIAT